MVEQWQVFFGVYSIFGIFVEERMGRISKFTGTCGDVGKKPRFQPNMSLTFQKMH